MQQTGRPVDDRSNGPVAPQSNTSNWTSWVFARYPHSSSKHRYYLDKRSFFKTAYLSLCVQRNESPLKFTHELVYCYVAALRGAVETCVKDTATPCERRHLRRSNGSSLLRLSTRIADYKSCCTRPTSFGQVRACVWGAQMATNAPCSSRCAGQLSQSGHLIIN